MSDPSSLWVFFPIAITLHNLEEAAWLPQWSRDAGRIHKPVEPNEFRFAVVIVTLLAYLATFAAVAAPESRLARLCFFGFLGVMIFNAFVPHLLAAVALRRYAPGLLTGLALLVPINGVILAQAFAARQLTWAGLLVSTAVVGVMLLVLVPVSFRLGRRWTR